MVMKGQLKLDHLYLGKLHLLNFLYTYTVIKSNAAVAKAEGAQFFHCRTLSI